MRDSGVMTHREAVRRLRKIGVQRALDEGKLIRLRHGWYATTYADPRVSRAIQAGGRLGCVSAAKFHDDLLWTPRSSGVHVCLRRSDMARPGLITHSIRDIGTAPVVGMYTALSHVARFHDLETTMCVIESAVDRRHLGIDEARTLVGKHHGARGAGYVTGLAQSGTETRVRLWLQQHRFHVQPQAKIDGVGYVDLLVGQCLVIELDSRAHHSDAADYQRDRERDLALIALGYRVVRLSYDQVWDEWAQTQQALLAILRTGKHLAPPKPLA